MGNAPKSMQDLFKARYKPSTNQTSNAPKGDSDAEAARLKLYEQKRAKFLAKKRAKSQQQQPQIPHPPESQSQPQSSSNYQAPQQPQEYRLPPQQIEIRQPSPPQQSQYHAQPPERPSVTFSEQKYENPSYTSDDHDIQLQAISNQNASNSFRKFFSQNMAFLIIKCREEHS